jgi:hypothetical protein
MQYTTEAAKYSVSRKFHGPRTQENNVRKKESVFLYSYYLQSTFADDDRRKDYNGQWLVMKKLKKTTEKVNTENWPMHSVE